MIIVYLYCNPHSDTRESCYFFCTADFCRSMYKEVVSMQGGKIMWSFVKPLIMGRILYTPPLPAVTRIIQKVGIVVFVVICILADHTDLILLISNVGAYCLLICHVKIRKLQNCFFYNYRKINYSKMTLK